MSNVIETCYTTRWGARLVANATDTLWVCPGCRLLVAEQELDVRTNEYLNSVRYYCPDCGAVIHSHAAHVPTYAL